MVSTKVSTKSISSNESTAIQNGERERKRVQDKRERFNTPIWIARLNRGQVHTRELKTKGTIDSGKQK